MSHPRFGLTSPAALAMMIAAAASRADVVAFRQWSPEPAREALPNRGEVGPSWR